MVNEVNKLGGFQMETVTILQQYKIIIPKSIRQQLNLKPSQRVEWKQTGGGLQMIPLPKPKSAGLSLPRG